MKSCLTALAVLAVALPVKAQQADLQVEDQLPSDYYAPIPISRGQVISSRLSAMDARAVGRAGRAEYFIVKGEKNETFSFQAQSEIPLTIVISHETNQTVVASLEANQPAQTIAFPFDGSLRIAVYAKKKSATGAYRIALDRPLDTFASTTPTPTTIADPTPAAAPPRLTATGAGSKSPSSAKPIRGTAAGVTAVVLDGGVRTSYYTPLRVRSGQIVTGSLTGDKNRLGPDLPADYLVFSGRAGQTVTVHATAPGLIKTQVRPRTPAGGVLGEGGREGAPYTVTLPADGDYLIVIAAAVPRVYGMYRVAVDAALQPSQMLGDAFDRLQALNGRSFVGAKGSLDIYTEGDAVVLHYGPVEKPRGGARWKLARQPGTRKLAILEHLNMSAGYGYLAELTPQGYLRFGITYDNIFSVDELAADHPTNLDFYDTKYTPKNGWQDTGDVDTYRPRSDKNMV